LPAIRWPLSSSTSRLTWIQGFALEHQYNLSNQTFGAWFVDELKGLGLSLVFIGVVPIAALSYWGIAKRPRDWWLVLAIGSLPVIVLGVLLQPLVFDPAFNKFTPLQDKQLESQILALAEKSGIPGRKVFEVNKSAQTKKLNAYVSGFGASQRIVLWDTTLKGMKADEILFVMGHEMGHYVLGHIWKGILMTVALSVLFFYLSYIITRWAVVRFGARWGFTELSDVASMPLIVGTIGLISFVAQPMTNSFSRGIEHEADQFGLEVTQLSDAGARAFIKLGAGNKSNPEPNPLVKAFIYTHPPWSSASATRSPTIRGPRASRTRSSTPRSRGGASHRLDADLRAALPAFHLRRESRGRLAAREACGVLGGDDLPWAGSVRLERGARPADRDRRARAFESRSSHPGRARRPAVRPHRGRGREHDAPARHLDSARVQLAVRPRTLVLIAARCHARAPAPQEGSEHLALAPGPEAHGGCVQGVLRQRSRATASSW
jgi:Zn-dependent protease with chaperone function